MTSPRGFLPWRRKTIAWGREIPALYGMDTVIAAGRYEGACSAVDVTAEAEGQ
jgi:hypothetical protein